jgi:hypothetical protein
MGRKLDDCCRFETFGIGFMTAFFHCRGTMDVARDRLKSLARGLENIGIPTPRNQDGS